MTDRRGGLILNDNRGGRLARLGREIRLEWAMTWFRKHGGEPKKSLATGRVHLAHGGAGVEWRSSRTAVN